MVENDNNNVLHDVQRYRKLVLIYEALDKQIDELIMSYGGGTANMPSEAFERYRELARQRDEMQNEIRLLEQQLMNDDI